MKFSLYIAQRYLFSKSKNNAINIITLIAGIGIIIGTSALLIVLSGFSGLKNFSLEFTSFTDPDLKLFPLKSKTITLDEAQRTALKNLKGIASFSEVVEERLLLNCDNKYLSVTVKGVDTNYPSTTVDSILAFGQWIEPQLPQIVAGWGITNTLGFGVFDLNKTIKLYAPKPGVGQVNSLQGVFKSLTVANVGVFQINETLDNSLVYTSIENAKYLLNLNTDQVSTIELILDPNTNGSDIEKTLNQLFNNQIRIKTRVQLNDALYKMLNTENVAVYLIFTLILIIALFNIIGSIIMMILDKQENIKTFHSLGATSKDVRQIFFLQGVLMTLIGGAIGLIIGVILVVLQHQFSLVMITPSLAYPVDLRLGNVVLVMLTITVLGIIASKIASHRVKNNS